jgi:hypothetical protein
LIVAATALLAGSMTDSVFEDPIRSLCCTLGPGRSEKDTEADSSSFELRGRNADSIDRVPAPVAGCGNGAHG